VHSATVPRLGRLLLAGLSVATFGASLVTAGAGGGRPASGAAPTAGATPTAKGVAPRVGAALVGVPQTTVTPPAAVRAGLPVPVAAARQPGTNGILVAYPDGWVQALVGATWHGSALGRTTSPVVGIASTPSGHGYWLAAADGQVFGEGQATVYGEALGRTTSPVVGIVATPSGHGYWLFAADGQVFGEGQATVYGTSPGRIVAAARTPDGRGYWMLAAGGRVYARGNARYLGGAFGQDPPGGASAIEAVDVPPTPGGSGYRVVAAGGQVYDFGGVSALGSADPLPGGARTFALLGDGYDAGGSYQVLTTSGAVRGFDAPSHAFTPADVPSGAGSTARGEPLPPADDPAANSPLPAGFLSECVGDGPVAPCDTVALAGIDAALASEGYGPLRLPSDFASLGVGAQLLAVTNAERSIRGLPAFVGPEPGLDAAAATGALAAIDPQGPTGMAWASIWAGGYDTPLAADFAWMYEDGPGGSNLDCTPADSAGCWGHRHDILAEFPAGSTAGVGAAVLAGGLRSFAELFVAGP